VATRLAWHQTSAAKARRRRKEEKAKQEDECVAIYHTASTDRRPQERATLQPRLVYILRMQAARGEGDTQRNLAPWRSDVMCVCVVYCDASLGKQNNLAACDLA
jgi:hypothetical protein